MKQDHYFKYLAAVIVIGVLVALIQPAGAMETKASAKTPAGALKLQAQP